MRFAPIRLATWLATAPRWLVGLAIIGVFLLHPLTDFGHSRFLARLEAIAYDARLIWTLPYSRDPQVVIVDIDEASLAAEGRWPWPRDKLARLVTQLFDRYQARAIGFDIWFPEADRSSGIDILENLARAELAGDRGYKDALARLRPRLDYDARFADAIRGRPVVLGVPFSDKRETVGALPAPAFSAASIAPRTIPIRAEQGYTGNLPILADAAVGGGHADPVFDADNLVRRVPLLKLYRGNFYPALSVALAKVVLEAKAIAPRFDVNGDLEQIDIGGLPVDVAPNGTALVPFRGGPQTFLTRPAAAVLAGTANPKGFAGTIVLVGTSAKGLQDLRPTPLSADFPGVEIHASLLAGMLNGDIKSSPPDANPIEALFMLVSGLLLLFAVPYRRPLTSALGSLLVIVTVIGANLVLWSRWNAVIPVAATIAMLLVLFGWMMIAGFIREARAISKLSDMFGEYVPRERVEQMRDSGQRFSLAGESRELTVLFCDVRNFTAVAERLAPRELSALMNAYLTPMTAAIHYHRGTIDKYIGDAIMAFWGAPVANPNHARDAVAAALTMQSKLPILVREFTERGWPPISIGIGVNTGTVSVGDMGSEFRKAYTVMGDPVNLASRVEALTKNYGITVIIGEETRRVMPDLACREIDRVRVRGKAQPVTIYEPLPTPMSPAETARLLTWKRALALYTARRFVDADAVFEELAADGRDGKLCALYRARCTRFRAAPPPVDWDRVADAAAADSFS